MTLDILIPQYKEDEQVIKSLLDSIAFQQNVDFNNIGVIIVNDGSDVILNDDFINSYPYRITYIKAKHEGVSATRQRALDESKADYVMFCDADDMFFNMCGLWLIFREMNEEFDALFSTFLEETVLKDTKEHIFITREKDSTFVHGKIYRRQYLLDNDIKWNPNLTIHEDSYFNAQALRLTPTARYCQTAFYLWKWRDTSVCRHDSKYVLKTYSKFIESSTALVRNFLHRARFRDAQEFATYMIYDAYFTMNKDEWINQDNKEYRDITEKRFAQYYKDFKELVSSLPIETKTQIIQSLRNRFYNEGMLLETTTFEQWINHIETLKDC